MLSCFSHTIGPNNQPLSSRGRFAGPQGLCDSSNLMPAGLTHAHPNAWKPNHPSGLTFLNGCSLAIGPFAAGDPSHAWQHADAILNCGLTEHQRLHDKAQCATAGMRLPNGMCKASEQTSFSISAASPAPNSQPASLEQQPVCRVMQESQSECISSSECCRNSPGRVCDAQSACSQQQPQQQNCLSADQCNDRYNGSNLAATGAWPAYLYLPVRSSKVDRQGLLRVLSTAMEFTAHHLRQGRSVLIHDDNGPLSVPSLVSRLSSLANYTRHILLRLSLQDAHHFIVDPTLLAGAGISYHCKDRTCIGGTVRAACKGL